MTRAVNLVAQPSRLRVCIVSTLDVTPGEAARISSTSRWTSRRDSIPPRWEGRCPQRPTPFLRAARTNNKRAHSLARAGSPRLHQPPERLRRRNDQGRWGQRPSPLGGMLSSDIALDIALRCPRRVQRRTPKGCLARISVPPATTRAGTAQRAIPTTGLNAHTDDKCTRRRGGRARRPALLPQQLPRLKARTDYSSRIGN